PYNSRGRRAAERLCSQLARAAKALVRNGGKCDHSMVGSLTRGSLSKGHRVQGAGSCPPTHGIHHSPHRQLLPLLRSLQEVDRRKVGESTEGWAPDDLTIRYGFSFRFFLDTLLFETHFFANRSTTEQTRSAAVGTRASPIGVTSTVTFGLAPA